MVLGGSEAAGRVPAAGSARVIPWTHNARPARVFQILGLYLTLFLEKSQMSQIVYVSLFLFQNGWSNLECRFYGTSVGQ